MTWHPTPASLERPGRRPVSAVPASYMQAQHLRGFFEFRRAGLDYSRLVMGSWDVPGRCDIRAMTYVINAHLRRHETYRSWFEYNGCERIVRHTIQEPADIEFVATEHGEMTQQNGRTMYWPRPIRCSGIASASASFNTRTTSHYMRLSTISTATRC